MKETTSVGSRTPGPQGPDQYGAKVPLETGGLGGGKGSLGHTGGLSTVTTGRFNFTGSAGLAFPSPADLRHPSASKGDRATARREQLLPTFPQSNWLNCTECI